MYYGDILSTVVSTLKQMQMESASALAQILYALCRAMLTCYSGEW